MIPYLYFRFIYPPRPDKAVAPEFLKDYDNGEYMAQPKLNGDCTVVFTNGVEVHVYNRHKKVKTKIKNTDRFKLLHRETVSPGVARNKWMVLVGEYMDKGKTNDWGENFNDSFVIFDILVYDSVQLVGKTFGQRVEMLDVMFGKDDVLLTKDGARQHRFLHVTPVPGVYRVKSFYEFLPRLWSDIIKIDMYEGLVLKRVDAPLENGITESNNMSGQVKFRKPTKNYLH